MLGDPPMPRGDPSTLDAIRAVVPLCGAPLGGSAQCTVPGKNWGKQGETMEKSHQPVKLCENNRSGNH